MKAGIAVVFVVIFFAAQASCEDNKWYVGDDLCPPPKDDGKYSAPYNALDHPHEYPAFPGADKPGWSCSYNREDGVIIQYGDSRTPQEQWLDLWGGNNENGN